jgi:hypothetical protein
VARSRLPLEERIFVPRSLPEVIVFGDGEAVAGPFCVNCGNPKSVHRDTDDACPVRRLHPLFPQGQRETCSCKPTHIGGRLQHHLDCSAVLYGYNGTVVR